MDEISWAPAYRAYGHNNRTLVCRLPMNRRCLELRIADSACNFYLGAAMTLAAGLDGIRKRLHPGPPVNVDTYTLSDQELAATGCCGCGARSAPPWTSWRPTTSPERSSARSCTELRALQARRVGRVEHRGRRLGARPLPANLVRPMTMVDRDKANATALERLCGSEPVLVGVRPAIEVVPGMAPETVLTGDDRAEPAHVRDHRG